MSGWLRAKPGLVPRGSLAYRRVLADHGLAGSVGDVASAGDNAA